MDRIYMNRIDGQRRIHIEIHDHEITDLLDDLKADPEDYAATHAFLDILRAAEETLDPLLAEARRDRAARQTGQQPDETVACTCDTEPEACTAVGESDPTTADDPTPLRWGLGDVLHGDDDTTTVCLSGPDGEPYWLELEPERAAAFRRDLVPPAADRSAAEAALWDGLTKGVQHAQIRQHLIDQYHAAVIEEHATTLARLAHEDATPAAGLDASQPATDPVYDPQAWETYHRDAGCGCTAPAPVDCKVPHGTGAWLCVCHRLSGPPLWEGEPAGTFLSAQDEAIRKHYTQPNRCTSVNGFFVCGRPVGHGGDHRMGRTFWSQTAEETDQ